MVVFRHSILGFMSSQVARSVARCVKTNFPKTGGGEKLRIFSENRGRPVALSQKTEGGPSRVECDLARPLRFEWRYLVAGARNGAPVPPKRRIILWGKKAASAR
jgi:hypothetical protein